MATVTLDRERSLAYRWGAIRRLSNELNISYLELVAEDEKWFLDPQQFSAMLWAGLIEEDPTLTIEQVDAMIRLPDLPAITKAMLAAVEESMAGGKVENPPTPSTG